MEFALDKDGNRVYADKLLKDDLEGKEFFCPLCGEKLFPRLGKIYVHHFAHFGDTECDPWHYDMSEWHKEWQNEFPEENREVIIKHEDEVHRADVCIGNKVIEFQHSPMSNTEFLERSRFYIEAGYEVYWLFDVIEQFSSGRLRYDSRRDDLLIWKHPWHTFDEFNLKKEAPKVFLQLGERTLDSGNIQEVTWMTPDNDRIIVDNDNNRTYEEFLELFMPKEETKQEQPELSLIDIHDCLPEEKIDGEYCVKCPLKDNDWENYENCQACEYCLTADRIWKRGFTIDDYNKVEYSPRINCDYVVNCMARYKDIYKGWNNSKDKVVEIKYSYDGARVTSTAVMKDGGMIGDGFDDKPVCRGLLEILANSDANVVGVRNVKTGARFKIGNSKYFRTGKVNGISGYIWQPSFKSYSKYKSEIYYVYDPCWIVEWEK